MKFLFWLIDKWASALRRANGWRDVVLAIVLTAVISPYLGAILVAAIWGSLLGELKRWLWR